jgi:hypothetical protein
MLNDDVRCFSFPSICLSVFEWLFPPLRDIGFTSPSAASVATRLMAKGKERCGREREREKKDKITERGRKNQREK